MVAPPWDMLRNAKGAPRYGVREVTVGPTRYIVENATDVCDGAIASYTGSVRAHPRFANLQKQQATQGVTETDAPDATHSPIPVVMDGRGTATMKDDRVYTGECTLGLFQGMGVMTYRDGSVYDGQWVDHLQHGYGTLDGPMTTIQVRDADGELVTKPVRSYSYTGLFRRGERDGQGDEIFQPSGDTFAGTFRDGKRHGVGRLVAANGDITDGVYVNGELEGLATLAFKHGDVLVGHFRGGKLHGKVTYTQISTGDKYMEIFADGICVDGVLMNNSTYGDVTRCTAEYRATGAKYSGGWKRTGTANDRKGERCGIGTLTFPIGDVYSGEFRDDHMEGEGTVTYSHSDYHEEPEADDDAASDDDVEFDLEVDPASVSVAPQRDVTQRHAANGEDDECSSVASSDLAEPVALDAALDAAGSTIAADPDADARDTTAFDERDVDGVIVVRFIGQFHRGLRHGRGRLELADGKVIDGFWCKGRRYGVFHTTHHNAKSDRRLVCGNSAVDGAERRGDATSRHEGAAVLEEDVVASALAVGTRVVDSAYFCKDVLRPSLPRAADLAGRVDAKEVAARTRPVTFPVAAAGSDDLA
jgi:hypothetical protein